VAYPHPFSVPSATLEGELAAVLRALGFDARQAGAVTARLGWDGRGGGKLREAAAPAGYTRERVRQLEARLHTLVERSGSTFALPLLDDAVEVVERLAPDSRSHVARELWAQGLVAGPFDPYGVLTAASLFGRGVRAGVKGDVVAPVDAPDPLKRVQAAGRRLASRRGAVSLPELALELGLDVPRARRLLSLVPEVRWLDRRENWAELAIPKLRRRMELILRKQLSLAPRLSLREVDEGMRRSFKPVAVPPAVLVDLCGEFDWIALDHQRRSVTSLHSFEPRRELSPIELAVASLFGARGEVLSFTEAVERGRERGLNRNSVGSYLLHSPIFGAVARGRYVLRGSL
jgi:hypothetical protein